MVEKATIARPYAKAIFELATEAESFEEWSNTLKLLTMIVEHDRVKRMLYDPSQNTDKMAEFFISVLGTHLNEAGKNLVRTLASRRRLIILPEIEHLYTFFRNRAENILPAICVTAIPLSQQQKEKFIEDFSRKFARQVEMNFEVNESMIGGFIVKAGDTIIDGTVRGQLNELKDMMSGGYGA